MCRYQPENDHALRSVIMETTSLRLEMLGMNFTYQAGAAMAVRPNNCMFGLLQLIIAHAKRYCSWIIWWYLMYACITPSSPSCHRATLGTGFVGLSVYMKSVQCQFTKSVRFIVAPIWTCLGTLDGKHIGVNAPDIDSLGIFQLFLLDPDGPWFPSQLDGVSSTGVLLRLEMLRSNSYILVQFEGYDGGQVDWKRSLDILW